MRIEKFSKHMLTERADRYVLIATKVGFGEVVIKTDYRTSDGRNTIMELTSTGVVFVRALDGTIITMYCTTLAYAKCYFTKGDQLPKEVYAAIVRNEKKGYCGV